MIRMTVSQAAMNFQGALARVSRGERVLLRRGGNPVAAIISTEDLALFDRLIEEEEDRIDNAEADRALAESDERIPYEDIRREMGLDKRAS